MSIEKLQGFLKLDRLTIEDKIEAKDILLDLESQIEAREVYVEEPDDIDDDVKMVWTEAQLKKLREAAVVAIANEMGIDASTRDAKADTIAAILNQIKTIAEVEAEEAEAEAAEADVQKEPTT